MPRTYQAPACVATRPATVPLTACRFCAGRGFQPTDDAALTVCVACDGGTWTCVAGNLGPTRSHPKHGRPFLFNPGSGLMTLTRGSKTESYTVKEFAPDRDPAWAAARAFEVVRTTGVRAGEVYHLLAGPTHISCDCAGQSYEATARADWRAYLDGRELYRTCGCVHSDALTLFLAAGLLDPPNEAPADQPEPQHT